MSHSPLPLPIAAYIAREGFWAGSADFDFWYALTTEERFWLHLRRNGPTTLAVALFSEGTGPLDVDLYDLSRAPIHGLRASIANTPLMTLARHEPPLPLIALRLSDGRHTAFTRAHPARHLADYWLDEALQRLFAALSPEWQQGHAALPLETALLQRLWPAWAGPCPPSDMAWQAAPLWG